MGLVNSGEDSKGAMLNVEGVVGRVGRLGVGYVIGEEIVEGFDIGSVVLDGSLIVFIDGDDEY